MPAQLWRSRFWYVLTPVLGIGLLTLAACWLHARGPGEAFAGRMLGAGLVTAALTAGLSLTHIRRLSSRFESVARAISRLANGQEAPLLPLDAFPELGHLTQSLEAMARQSRDRLAELAGQRNELEAVLASMVEAVIAFDRDLRVLKLNRAAADVFGLVPGAAVNGKHLREVIRNTDLHRFVERTMASDDLIEGQILLLGEEDLYLSAHGTRLQDASGQNIGGVIALNDVTRLIRLESARREFVANVSHELRTPITAIKGYVETLLDGALEDPETARRFLGIVARHTERIGALIEDLLALSRLERETEEKGIDREPCSVDQILQGAVAICQEEAEHRNIRLVIESPGGLIVSGNFELLQLALANLIDNAIKYTYEGTLVQALAVAEDDQVRLSVVDQGPGIEKDHHERLFERFYRVDEARSRARGGTGLGLAIVKHIARVHAGRASVESAPGKGSAFSLHLPLAAPKTAAGAKTIQEDPVLG